MLALTYKNANTAFVELYTLISKAGQDVVVRGQKTKELCGVVIELVKPQQRVIWEQSRKFKEQAALAEFLWYMTANNSVKVVEQYIPRWKEYSDDGDFVNSNYGVAWKRWAPGVLAKLRQDKFSRQAVIVIYKSVYLEEPTKDVPCTVSIQFLIRNEKLDMIVYMRSNDLWYGFCIDQFCFSLLQEMVANELSLPVGTYTHFAGSMHIYEDKLGRQLSRYVELVEDTNVVHNFTTFWTSLVQELDKDFTNDYIATLIKHYEVNYENFLNELR